MIDWNLGWIFTFFSKTQWVELQRLLQGGGHHQEGQDWDHYQGGDYDGDDHGDDNCDDNGDDNSDDHGDGERDVDTDTDAMVAS